MSASIITLNGNSVTLVATPSTKVRGLELHISDAIATVSSPYTGQTQTQSWPGGDMWSGTVTLPDLAQVDADAWIAFLMELRGMQNAFQIGDRLKATPRGTPAGTPLIDNSANGGNPAMSQALATKGWTASAPNVLLPGDYVQVGYRLHRVLDAVSADSSGKAVLSLWPSLREQPTDSSALITSNCLGLFRLANNQRTWSVDYTRVTRISFPILEYR
jgi:hypothetical protein